MLVAWAGSRRPTPVTWRRVCGLCSRPCRSAAVVGLVRVVGVVRLDRGEPAVVPGLAGLVEAPPEWVPALRAVAAVEVWQRIIAVLPDAADPTPLHPVRRLVASDAAALGRLDASIAWISETWGGHPGLAAAGAGWVAVADGRVVAVAAAFYVGRAYEDIGVVTEPGYRGRGFATACAAAISTDIRARGRQPSWSTSPDNAGSRGVAERLGFVHARDDVLYAVGTPVPAA